MNNQEPATKSITLKTGDQFYASTTGPDGHQAGELWTVIRTTRRTIEIEAAGHGTTRSITLRK